MRLSGFNNVYHGVENRTFQAASRSTKSSFLNEMEKTRNAAMMEKVKDSVEKTQYDTQLKLAYEHLSPSSKNVLERLNTGKNDITKDEWMGLSKELKDAGLITESDFHYSRADGHLIPIGYYDESGNFVKYDTPPMLVEELRTLSKMFQSSSVSSREAWQLVDDWTGDPFEYLDSWVSELYSWRSDLARMRAADGSPKYNNFTPITDQINSCQKVVALVKDLAKIN